MTEFKISYDYRCPFAKNLHLHLVRALRAGAEWSVEFSPWTMSQGHRAEGAPDVWADPTKDPDLLALAVSVSVRDHQPDRFLDAHEALFRARHESGLRLASWEDIDKALANVQLDVDAIRRDVASRRPHGIIADTFHEFERYEAFGVPTVVIDGDGTFIRYMSAPDGNDAASVDLITRLIALMTRDADLNEFKHTRVPY